MMDQSMEAHFYRHNIRGRYVYHLIILFVVFLLGCLPLIRVDITFAVRGILRTEIESCQLISPVSGKVRTSYLVPNARVHKGDTLLVLEHAAIVSEMESVRRTMAYHSAYINDLKKLIDSSGIPGTSRYREEQERYRNEIGLLVAQLAYNEDKYLTNKPLYTSGFIARMEFESIRKGYQDALRTLEVRKKEYRTKWLSQVSENELRLLELGTRLDLLVERQDACVICAHADGSLADLVEIAAGSYVHTNQQIARIIPERELIGTCLIPTDRISRIDMGQRVMLHIDSYPVAVYGSIKAEVSGVPGDASSYSGGTGFPVRLRISREVTGSRQGRRITLKSGMTFTGMFVTARKSLLEIIIERGDRLLLPAPKTESDEKVSRS